MQGMCGSTACVPLLPADNESEDGDEPFPIWKGMSAFEAGESEPPPAGVIVVDPFCDYLGKRCIKILEEAGYAVVQARSQTKPNQYQSWHVSDKKGIVIPYTLPTQSWRVCPERVQGATPCENRQHQRALCHMCSGGRDRFRESDPPQISHT